MDSTSRATIAHIHAAAKKPTVTAIIPVLDEETAIGDVVAAVRSQVDDVIVVDGSSTDRTVERARAAGAQVVIDQRPGYGRAMQTGIASIGAKAEIVLFIDGDGSDRAELVPEILAPIVSGKADFVHGSRLTGAYERGSLSLTQRLAGKLAGLLIYLLYGIRYTDMSPFRAISRDALANLGMRELSFGWNLEMQMRAAAAGLRIVEVPVGQRIRKGGNSKVSGNFWVAIRAVWILTATFIRLSGTLRKEGQANRR